MRFSKIGTTGATTLVAVVLFVSAPATQNSEANRYWGQWRGPLANGLSPTANPPLEWSETRNIRWKVEIPGRGSSSPIVWGDRLFVTTAVPAGVTGAVQHAPRGGLQPRGVHRFVVMAIDRQTGKTFYQNQRLAGLSEAFSSPVGGRGRLYFTGRDGTTLVIKSGPTLEVLAKNVLDDGFDASAALVDNEIYMRGYRYLYAIAGQ